MMIDANGMHFQALNRQIREASDPQIVIEHCCGQRYIASGLSGKTIDIRGIPGNALGAYLDSGRLFVHGNAQDAVGDTMNDGEICIDGMAGDAAGYAMRGGRILIRGDVGYRAGIHMKAYRDKQPVMVIGGEAGRFLGEYQAGGTIVVLGLHTPAGRAPVGNFCGMGMHGGKIVLRTDTLPADFSERLLSRRADETDLAELRPALDAFCAAFGEDPDAVMAADFTILTPNSRNPYQQLYAAEQ